jgi:hypothetical protein
LGIELFNFGDRSFALSPFQLVHIGIFIGNIIFFHESFAGSAMTAGAESVHFNFLGHGILLFDLVGVQAFEPLPKK